jgi:methionine-rich copper-binding protein CopC
MKKHLLSLTLALTSFFAVKSQVIIDTVSIGASYANQVWYSLANDNQGAAPKNNWDLAFDVSGQGSSIHINSITGTTLWNYPNADTSGWNTLDTTGINTWAKRWNSDTAWYMGAMGRYASPTNSSDLDWGMYSTITHAVTGDSLYVIKLANGTYKKLRIISLASGSYNFRYADLNGTNLQNASLAKATYTNQNFGYYSIQNNVALSREPLTASWDLLFTQYTAFLSTPPTITPYSVTGILQNKNVRVAEVKPIANANSYTNWNIHTLKTAINEIGYDWKVFTSSFVIEDSLVYFVKAKNGDIWKVIPTGFGGSANGNFIFSKEKLSAVGINENNGKEMATMAVYPNPSKGNDVTVVLSAGELTQVPALTVYDMNGKAVKSMQLENTINNQVNVFNLNTESLATGVYMVDIKIGNYSAHQKLIISK